MEEEELFHELDAREELFVYLKGRYMDSAQTIDGAVFPSFLRDGICVADVLDVEIWDDVDSYIKT